jgi:hypothetical protein
VAKLSIAGNTLVYSTYLGGSGGNDGTGIAVDPHGHAHVTGWTWSSDFPTQNPLQAVRGGGIDAFVAKLNAAGTTLIYSTYLGGYDEDRGMGIAVDPRGHAYVAGDTWSEDFPVSPRVLQPVFGGGVDRGADYLRGDAFVSKITHRSK